MNRSNFPLGISTRRPMRARDVAGGCSRTTWIQRFSNVIARFCADRPPVSLVSAYFGSEDSTALQDWVNLHLQPDAAWAQGIEIIDAAERLADTPAEGGAHAPRGRRYRRPPASSAARS